jgi:CSLREA domain-containing protein
MRLLTRLFCASVIALSALFTSLIAPTASASNFIVNSLGDTPDALTSDGLCADAGGACTLRAAIQQANADPSGDVIGFSVNGTINLTSALPSFSKSMTISGPGAGQLTVRRNSAEPYRIFVVNAGADITMSGLTVSNGLAPLPVNGGPSQEGGGIYNAGGMALTGVTVSGNATSNSPASATPVAPSGGGGIYNSGTLLMTDCNVSENSTGSALAGTSLSGGNGGGILNTGTLIMHGSSISFNHTGAGGDGAINGGAGGAGGGLFNAPSATLAILSQCDVSENTTGRGATAQFDTFAPSATNGNGGNGGGIYNASSMSLGSTIIARNVTGRGADARAGTQRTAGKGGKGGGIYNTAFSPNFGLNVTNCVLRNNVTGNGGIGSGTIQSQGDGGDGGGIANESASIEPEVTLSTIVFNQTGLAGDSGGRDGVGGGVYGKLAVRSSVVALNFTRFPSNLSDVAGGPFDSGGYNYMGYFGVACCYTTTDRGGAGGPTALLIKLDPNTLIPLPGSQLIDVGLARDFDNQPITEDIRGAVRPFDFPSLTPQPGGDDSDIGAFERLDTDPTPTPMPTVQFVFPGFVVAEEISVVMAPLERTGPKDGTTVVNYVFKDFSAHQRGDFTYKAGRVTFAPGEDMKEIAVLLSEDAYAEGQENFIIAITGITGGEVGARDTMGVVISDDDATDGTFNPIDDNANFVGQHYHDFFSRQSDPGGQAFWTAQLDACNGDAACLDRKRVDVSAAFFLSIEFQNTGYYVIRVNKAAFGDQPATPAYFSFLEQTQEVGSGVIVGQPGYEAVLEANKQRFAEQFVQRTDFILAHGGQTAAQYVDSLFVNAGVTPTVAERNAAISAYASGGVSGQAAALRSVVESGSVYNRLYNPAFVLMQYFAYLRRDPNAAPDTNFDGYNFWLNKLNSVTLPGEDARDERVALARVRRAEMIRAFLRSSEYRGRFAGDPNKGN